MGGSAWLADAADLLLGHVCLGCAELGRELCAHCLRRLRGRGMALPGPPTTLAAAGYEGLARTAVLAYKEDGHRSLAAPLGVLLADAIVAAGTMWQLDDLQLVRVPGHPRPRRGFDALGGILRQSRGFLERHGRRATIVPALAISADYQPAKNLGRQARERQLRHAFVARPPARPGLAPVIVVDDVMTSGATLREAVRALRLAGHTVAGAAVVCAVQPR